jgi:hypothetical protein
MRLGEAHVPHNPACFLFCPSVLELLVVSIWREQKRVLGVSWGVSMAPRDGHRPMSVVCDAVSDLLTVVLLDAGLQLGLEVYR